MEDPAELFFLCLESNWAFRIEDLSCLFSDIYIWDVCLGVRWTECVKGVFLSADFKSSVTDWLVCGWLCLHRWISLWRSTVKQFSGNVWRKKKTDGTGDFSVGCSFPPGVTQMGYIHSSTSPNCAAILVTGLPQRREKQSRTDRKSPEQ